VLGNAVSPNDKEPEATADETAGAGAKPRTSLSSDEVEIIGAIPKDRSRRYVVCRTADPRQVSNSEQCLPLIKQLCIGSISKLRLYLDEFSLAGGNHKMNESEMN